MHLVRPEFYDLLQAGEEAGAVLAGQAADEVDVDADPAGLQRGVRGGHLGQALPPGVRVEDFRVHGLHADADPADAAVRVGRKFFFRHVVGVQLQYGLRAARHLEAPAQQGKELTGLGRRHHGRRAAADVESGKTDVLEKRGVEGGFLVQRGKIAPERGGPLFAGRADGRDRQEAEAAAGAAERHVDEQPGLFCEPQAAPPGGLYAGALAAEILPAAERRVLLGIAGVIQAPQGRQEGVKSLFREFRHNFRL